MGAIDFGLISIAHTEYQKVVTLVSGHSLFSPTSIFKIPVNCFFNP